MTIYQVVRVKWAAEQRITAPLSMLCSGIVRTGAPWRDLPPDYGDWKNTHRRFSRWRDRGLWENLLNLVMDAPDFE